MANKITQLVNKDGDNLYPLSGGLLSDSVTTDMLQDESVTSDKIDWSTVTSTALTPNTTYVDPNIGSAFYLKFGRLVVMFFNNATVASASSAANVFSGAPMSSSRVTFSISGDNNKAYRCRILENTDNVQIEGGFPNSLYFSGSVAYFADN